MSRATQVEVTIRVVYRDDNFDAVGIGAKAHCVTQLSDFEKLAAKFRRENPPEPGTKFASAAKRKALAEHLANMAVEVIPGAGR